MLIGGRVGNITFGEDRERAGGLRGRRPGGPAERRVVHQKYLTRGHWAVYLFILLFILFVSLPSFLLTYLSVCVTSYLSVYLHLYLSVYITTCLCVNLCTSLSVFLPVC